MAGTRMPNYVRGVAAAGVATPPPLTEREKAMLPELRREVLSIYGVGPETDGAVQRWVKIPGAP